MKIGLVLSGGGARGFAHIGVLRSLVRHGIEPVAVAGCSIGGIVGGLIAAGRGPDEIHEILRHLKPWELLDWSRMGSLIGGKGIAHHLQLYLPATFADLDIPLAVTAVDLQEGKLVVFREGPLLPALRATSSLPGIISPEKHGGRLLIDGGLLNYLPVDVIRSLTHAPVLAVDVAQPPNRRIPVEEPFLKRVTEIVRGRKRPLTFELFMKAFDIPATRLTEMRLALNPPELLIRPDLDPDLKTEDFMRLDEAVEVGYRAAEAALEEGMAALQVGK
jgi:NTE family protein